MFDIAAFFTFVFVLLGVILTGIILLGLMGVYKPDSPLDGFMLAFANGLLCGLFVVGLAAVLCFGVHYYGVLTGVN